MVGLYEGCVWPKRTYQPLKIKAQSSSETSGYPILPATQCNIPVGQNPQH